MTDMERLQEWMSARDMTLSGLARELDGKYNSLWNMAIRKGQISDGFLVRFIRRYGCDEALRVFPEHLVSQRSS